MTDATPLAWIVRPVATVSSGRDEVVDDSWGNVEARIVMIPPYGADSLVGLTDFSHLDVLYLFDRVDPSAVHIAARRPRDNPAWPEVGIFAQRAKDRPNRIGVCTCELLGVVGATVHVRGLDAVDGTPVLDVKPYMEEFGPRGRIRQPPWSRELMATYWSGQ